MKYFVYFTSIKNGCPGDGNCNVTRDTTINDIADIKDIESEIKKIHDFNSVVVSNFIRLN